MKQVGGTELTWWKLEETVPRLVPHVLGDLAAFGLLALAFGPVVGAAFLVGVLVLRLLLRGEIPTLEAYLRPRLSARARAAARRRSGGRVVTALVGLAERIPLERRIANTMGRLLSILAGFLAGWLAHRGAGMEAAVARGVTVALAFGIAIGMFTVSPRTSPREATRPAFRGSGTVLRHLAIGIGGGACVALATGVVFHSALGVLVGAALGISLGLVDGLNTWLDISTDITRALSPESTRYADRRAALARATAAGVLVMTTSGIAQGLTDSTRHAVVHGAAFGTAFFIGDRYSGLTSTSWGRYVLATTWLALAGRLPWRFASFLEDAYRHGLLRRTGVAYQFRHVRFQERLSVRAGQATTCAP